MSRWDVLARDATGRITGPVKGWTSLELYLKHLDVGSITITNPGDAAAAQLLTPGAGVVVLRDGMPLTAGPVNNPTDEMSAGDGNPPPGTFTIVAPDDLVTLADRITYPEPTKTYAAQAAGTYDTRSGPAETVILGYIAANTGSTAPLAARRTPLVVPVSAGRGASVPARQSRFENLLSLVQALAQTGGLGLRVAQDLGGYPGLQVFQPVDRSGEVYFDVARGNLTGYTLSQTCSTGNVALVAGDPAAIPPPFLEVANSDSVALWSRRVEAFVDSSDTAQTANLQQAAAEALAEAVDTVNLALTAVDTAQTRFGDSYGLGDIVTARVAGKEITQVVRQVHITVDATGELVEPTLGTPGAADASPTSRLIRQLLNRVALLEARQ